jgi:DNA-binding MarR family transcriptional regulator
MNGVKRELPAVEPHVPMLMGLVFGRMRARLAEEPLELRPSQARVLEWLPPAGLTISELAERTGMTTQGCGQFVRQLAELGMVEVFVADHDARARRVQITLRGREALDRALRFVAACEEDWEARVGPDRYQVFPRGADRGRARLTLRGPAALWANRGPVAWNCPTFGLGSPA